MGAHIGNRKGMKLELKKSGTFRVRRAELMGSPRELDRRVVEAGIIQNLF